MKYPFAALTFALLFVGLSGRAAAPSSKAAFVRLTGQRSARASLARPLAPAASVGEVRLALTLPLRNQAALDDLLRRLYDPADPLFERFLSADEFAARFAPTAADYAAVADFARASGLRVVEVAANRAALVVAGPSRAAENAFGVRLLRFQARDGLVFRAPDREPAVPAALAGRLAGVVGLESGGARRPKSRTVRGPHSIGSGWGGGLTPGDIKAAYNLQNVALTGAGQTLGLYQLDGYRASDITAYENAFGLPHAPLENVLVAGASGTPGVYASEVTLDIELQLAMAPGAAKIIVYEAPNDSAGSIACFNRIASENRAKAVSTSWGLPEGQTTDSERAAENAAFQQMAAQGQTIFDASGDGGAYDDGATLSVDDPGGQPFMCTVGGTALTTYGPGGAWLGETTWKEPASQSGGGGGTSRFWPKPSYQSGLGASATMRDLPDVSLNADPRAAYAIYFNGQWELQAGTSCAAPLWAGLTALINQRRVANGRNLLGFANPALYTVGRSGTYRQTFHDIADGSDNLFYVAKSGFDDATGWGTPFGNQLILALAPTPASLPVASVSVSPSVIYGGQAVTGTVRLTAPAPSVGARVALSSSRTWVASVPAFVLVPSGATGKTFNLGTYSVNFNQTTVISATSGGVTRTANLTSYVAAAQSLSLSPMSVRGGLQNSLGTVTLTGPAFYNTGTKVLLSSSDAAAASVPASVTVAPGQRTAAFTVTSRPVSAARTATITATAGGASKSVGLSVTP